MVSQTPTAIAAIKAESQTNMKDTPLTGKICTQIWAHHQTQPTTKPGGPPIGSLALSISRLWDNGTTLTVRIDGYSPLLHV